MSKSIFSVHRDKTTFENPQWFRIGDEFLKINGKIIYLRLRDEKS